MIQIGGFIEASFLLDLVCPMSGLCLRFKLLISGF